MTDRRNFLKQTATLTALGTLPYPFEADERATKNNAANVAPPLPPTDIRSLTQHFNQPGGGIEPWIFVPKSNIAEISTEEHPGAVTVRQAGKGADIKGILQKPIGIGDFPLPWEFQMSLLQNPLAVLLGVGDIRQNNTAIGLNVALTFSDPSTWPADRTQRPPDTHDFQLLVVHLGNTGEFGSGLPQFAPYRTPEIHLVWGRGDLAPALNGDWKIPYFFQGSMPDAGPASPQVFFRFHLSGPSGFTVGIKFNDWNEFYLRSTDCSRFGKITGVWEIGPIFSCDRWIPDVLCKELPVLHPEISTPPEPIPPNPIHEFTVDYCAFLPCAPTAPFESFSDEFDVPGFLSWRGFQLPFQAETWSHPGHLTITLLGASQGTWFFPMTLTEIDLNAYPPPWEWEVCFTPPASPAPWNLYFNHRLIDSQGQWKTYWKPGVMYDPRTKRAHFTNDPFGPSSFDSQMDDYFRRNGQDPAKLKPWVKVIMVFDPEPPQEVMQARPLRMLYQMLDKSHLRMGFRGSADGPWHLSKVLDVTEVMGGEVGRLGETCLGIVNGRHFSLPPGTPMYAQYQFDYIRFRRQSTVGD